MDKYLWEVDIECWCGEVQWSEKYFFYGTQEESELHAGKRLETYWGEGTEQIDYGYYSKEGDRGAELNLIHIVEGVLVFTADGSFWLAKVEVTNES